MPQAWLPTFERGEQLRIALYARVSTEGKGQDEENQLAELRKYAGAELTTEYVDRVSASGLKVRPQYAKMFEDARRKRFDLILFWSLDRFSREGSLPTLNALNLLTSYGCNWKSLTEQYLDSTGIFRDAVIAILAAVAKQERIRISERTKAGLARVRAAGKVLGRTAIVINPDELRRRREGGQSSRQIAEEMGLKKSRVHQELQKLGIAGWSPDHSSASEETEVVELAETPDPECLPTPAAESALSAAVAQIPETPKASPLSAPGPPPSLDSWR